MPITFLITDPASCRWAISPLRETLSAVRLLTQPHRQGYHQPWLRAVAPARQVRAELSRCLHKQHGRRLPPPAQRWWITRSGPGPC